MPAVTPTNHPDLQLPALDRPAVHFRQVPLGGGLTAWNLEVTYPQFLSSQESQALKLEFAGPTLANVVDRAIESLLDRPGEGAGAAQKALLERPLSLDQLAGEIIAIASAPVLAAVLIESRKDDLRRAIWVLLEPLGFKPGQLAAAAAEPATDAVPQRPQLAERLIRRVTPILNEDISNTEGEDVG